MIWAFGIYCIALAKAWRNRRALAGLFNPLNENPFGALVTTEVEIVSSPAYEVGEDDHYTLAERTKAPFSPFKIDPSSYSASVQAQDAVQGRQISKPRILRVGSLTRDAALSESNAEAWLFARVAFLFFAVMVICWTPASINRLYSTIRPTELVFGLNYAAGFMLPLQGLLNAIVYGVSSQSAVRRFFRGRFKRRRFPTHIMKTDRGSRSSYIEVSDSFRKAISDQRRSTLPSNTTSV